MQTTPLDRGSLKNKLSAVLRSLYLMSIHEASGSTQCVIRGRETAKSPQCFGMALRRVLDCLHPRHETLGLQVVYHLRRGIGGNCDNHKVLGPCDRNISDAPDFRAGSGQHAIQIGLPRNVKYRVDTFHPSLYGPCGFLSRRLLQRSVRPFYWPPRMQSR